MRIFRRAQLGGPLLASRLLAGFSYLGGVSLLLLLLAPRSPFVARHLSLALRLHLLRFVWTVSFLSVYLLSTGQEQPQWVNRFMLDISLLLLGGVPWLAGSEWTLLLALSLPLGFTWLLGLTGAVIAVTGHTADISAFLHAAWPDAPPALSTGDQARGDERLRVRELTEQRLDRIWHASRVAVNERQRRERIDQLELEIRVVLARLDNINHMLSLGEISLARFNRINAELIAYLDRLRMTLSDMRERRSSSGPAELLSPPAELVELPPVRARTLAVIDPSGMPLITYGHFPLDESVITGMVSAFETLSVEMFGSTVHTTQLSEGQVVHFIRGQVTVAFVIFEDEPSPKQISQLREFLDEFERANTHALSHLPVERSELKEVDAPFEFTQRVNESDAPDEPTPVIGAATHLRRL